MGGSRRPRRLWVPAASTLAVAWLGASGGVAGATAPAWSIVPSASPAGAGVLSSVTCFSASDCMAVGSTITGEVTGKTLAERWNGARWSIVASANPDNNAGLNALSCASAAACVAVGNHGKLGNDPLVERWDGKTWTPAASPTSGTSDITLLSSVSCPSVTRCMVVGYLYHQETGEIETIAERWDGKRLSVVPTPNGKSGGSFSAVTCVSASNCTAVGAAIATFPTRVAMVAHWDGHHWSAVSTHDPPGSKTSTLAGVSCTSSTMCVAVGTWARSSDPLAATFTLTERWNGKSWSYVASPKPVGVVGPRSPASPARARPAVWRSARSSARRTTR